MLAVQVLTLLFQDYVDVTLEYIRRNLKPITNVMEINMVMTICYLLDAMLPNTSNDGNHGAAHKNKVSGSVVAPCSVSLE